MRTLILKILIIVSVVVTLADIFFGLVLPKMILQSNDSYINRWHAFYMGHTPADLVCLGSSRIYRHCDPTIISGITHLKTEVVATAGANIYFFEQLYRDYLKRNPRPKLLLIGIDLTGLGNRKFVPNPEYFYPFLNPSDAIASYDEYHLIKYYKPFGYFYYKESYYDIATSPEKAQHYLGYLPVDKPWDNNQEPFGSRFPHGFDLEVNDGTISELMQFMHDQEKQGTSCVGIIAPEYQAVWKVENNRRIAIAKLFEMASFAHIRILNFSDSAYQLCFNKAYFFNSQHLNRAGAELFSKDLADSIKALDQ